MTSSAWSVDSGVPDSLIARSAATTVGSTGSEWTVMSSMPHSASVRSSLPRKSNALLTPRRTQHGDIFFGEMAEMVGAEDLPPAHDAAVVGGIAAKVAEIAGAGEVEMAGRGF